MNANQPSNPRVALEIARALQHLDRHFFELERKRFIGRLTRKLHQAMRMRAKVNDQLLVHIVVGPMRGTRPESSTAFATSA